MRAKAPGKLVISGAYAVLRGTPAIVTAVDRYVTADDARSPTFETPEVAAALRLLGRSAPHPWFSADELRDGDRKLGLGSSAGICAASVALLWQSGKSALSTDNELAQAIYNVTLAAHRQAQGGGSGIDVAAACFGGTLGVHLAGGEGQSGLVVEPLSLPSHLVVETWACSVAASTAQFVKKVFSLETQDPRRFQGLLGAQETASRKASMAAKTGHLIDFVAALRAQVSALAELGDAAQVPIVLPEVRAALSHLDPTECFIPSGAGGGDVTLFMSDHPSTDAFRKVATELGFYQVQLGIGARGVHLLGD